MDIVSELLEKADGQGYLTVEDVVETLSSLDEEHSVEKVVANLRRAGVEFDVEDMWEKILGVIKSVNLDPAVKKDPVEALATSTFGDSFTPIDENGDTLYNTIYSSLRKDQYPSL